MTLEFSTVPIGKDNVPSVVISVATAKSRPFISIFAAWRHLGLLYQEKQITAKEFLLAKDEIQHKLIFVPWIEWLDALIALTHHVFPNFPDTANFTA